MSDTDSFIEEVSEEVRRDRLFGYMRKYGWIAVLAVVLIVGGASYNEIRKSQARADAQATGDEIFAAVEQNDNAARIAALQAIEPASPEAQMMIDFLLASHQLLQGENPAAADTLEGVANASGTDVPEIYRQVALFKSVVARGPDMDAATRRSTLEALAAPGAPLALMAQEQIALLEIEEGNIDAALAQLEAISMDSSVTPGLLRRATQLIVALGGTPPAVAGLTASE
ncbi:hypothetical protein [uncultured Shimia sp.]|uniref:hypothetical protein n=1 Tax=uncultured Shimia sp. TaxID=573152 RepID=UPI00262F54D5|nr:hypothetical protein [uncultured Shimia sp.]